LNFALLSIFLLVFKCGMLTIIFLRDLDVCIIKINQRSFLIGPKEHILSIIMNPLEGLDAIIVKCWRTDISSACIPRLQMLLKQQVIGGCDVIMLISLDTPLCVFNVEVELLEF
jgi:hypothetical protein